MCHSITRPPERSCLDLHTGEEGMLSLASLFVLLGFVVLGGLLVNVGVVTSRKIETQNTADSVAYSASIEMARGMNSVTALNHLIGELTALVVLIHTLGGDELDQGKSPPAIPQTLKTWLDTAHDAADGLSSDAEPQAFDDAYDHISKDCDVGGAIYNARKRLKMVLAWAYQAHAFGGLIVQGQYIPIVGPALEGFGDSICAAAYAFEWKAYLECLTLEYLEDIAKTPLQQIKTTVRDVIIPALYAYQKVMVGAAPVQASRGKLDGNAEPS